MQRLMGRLGAVAGMAALVAGGLVVVVPSEAGAAPTPSTVCATTTLSGTITGNVTVPNTSRCTITTATVTGSVKIGTSATFIPFAVEIAHSTIDRNISGNTIGLEIVTTSTVLGNVSTGLTAILVLYEATIDGNLGTTSSFSVNVVYSGVSGNASFNNTLGFISICGFYVSVCGGTSFYSGVATTNPHHPYKLSNVSITTTQAVAVFVGNIVSGNLTCSGNGVYFTTFIIDFTNTIAGHASGQCATPTFYTFFG